MSAHAKRPIAQIGTGQSLPITSTLLVPDRRDRIEVQIVNSGSTAVWLAFQVGNAPGASSTPVAVVTGVGSGYYLAAGAVFKTNAYTGPIYGISVTSPNIVSVLEI